MPKQKFNIYLAGPISGCNDIQVHRWRDEVKQKFGKHMDFIDPSEIHRASSYEIVSADNESIEQADGLLVNMWRESLGSAIGIVHAHRSGKPVVVANPNHLRNSILEFYATAVEETPIKAARTLRDILRADAGWQVKKTDGREEDFNREKLVRALRAASRSARRNNIVAPVLIMPKIIERLSDRKLQKLLHVSDINNAVLGSLEELESSDGYASAVKGISEKWKAKSREEKPKRPKVQTAGARQTRVPITSSDGKPHATIWGKIKFQWITHIPSKQARKIFQVISEVEGITKILIGQRGSQKRKTTCATVKNSNNQFIIEGNLYESGGEGTMQAFQVHVQIAERRDVILNEIIGKLKEANYWTNS